MKNIFVLLTVVSVSNLAQAAAPLRCQGVLNPPPAYSNYVGQVALYFDRKESKTARLWHQYPNGSSKTYDMSCHLQYVGDGPSTFVCEEDSTDELKFTFSILGSYSRTRPSGLSTRAFIGVQRDGEDGRPKFLANVGEIVCN